MRSFKQFVAESRRTSVEAGIQNHSKHIQQLRDKFERGLTPESLIKDSEKQYKLYKQYEAEILKKLDTKGWFNSTEHKMLKRKMNTAMVKSDNLKRDADIIKQFKK